MGDSSSLSWPVRPVPPISVMTFPLGESSATGNTGAKVIRDAIRFAVHDDPSGVQTRVADHDALNDRPSLSVASARNSAAPFGR
jgi:hypothetical protein